MILRSIRMLSKVFLAAFFALTSVSAIVATQAANPAQPGAQSGVLTATSQPAAAQGYRHYRHGYYAWHGRYWAHRRWHAGYWGPYHRWHAGFWVYF